MAEIRSALEIALEKADRLGRADKEDLERTYWLDRGRRLAATYLNEPGGDLLRSMKEVPAPHIPVVLRGAMEALLRNIALPRDQQQWATLRSALRGIVEIKGSAAAQVVDRIEKLLQTFDDTCAQYRKQMRSQMQARVGGLQQAVAQRYGKALAGSIDVESLPEFQQEWSRLSADIKEQFERQLNPLKAYLEQL